MDKAEIEEMEYRLIDGIINSDLNFLENVMHDNLLGIAPNGELITKQMDLASHRAGTMIVEELIPHINNIQVIDDTAIVIVTYDTKGTMLSIPIEGRFKYNRVWKKFDDELKIIAVSCIQVPTE
nr:nuclear transport factor 2 family protein [uncultured Carboxylicivirga sp.]